MSSTVSVGFAKKLGLPDYGSIGANCNLQVDLDTDLLHTDPVGFRKLVRKAYRACSRAVQEELARQSRNQSAGGSGTVAAADPVSSGDNARDNTGHGNGNGRPMTDKQLRFARQLAGQIKGLGARQLDSLANQHFGKPVTGLSSFEASGLIDTLKEMKAAAQPESVQGAIS